MIGNIRGIWYRVDQPRAHRAGSCVPHLLQRCHCPHVALSTRRKVPGRTNDFRSSGRRLVRDYVPDVSKPLKTGEIIGRVDIPRLRLSAAVAEGDDDKTLGNAVGHLPDTPLPWHRRGNVALAAHRDGLFRSLEGVRLNDDVRVVTSRGEFHYRVTKTHIVDPDDVWVIAPTDTPTITLITCYPFAFIGNAPRRFIVQAELVEDPGGSVLKGSVVR